MCFIYFFRSSTEPAVFAQCVWATLAQLLGSASPDVRLRVRGVAVTDSVRFCGGGFNSFLGFEYGVVITLASHVFEYFFLSSYEPAVFEHFWLRWGHRVW